MTKLDERTLRQAVNEVVLDMGMEQSSYTVPEALRIVRARYAEAVREIEPRLADETICDMIRQAFKAQRPVNSEGEQMRLPFDIAQLNPAHSISVPRSGGEGQRWIPFHVATRGQLKQHRHLLITGIENDQKRLKAVEAIIEYLEPLMEGMEDDAPIGPVLEKMADVEQMMEGGS